MEAVELSDFRNTDGSLRVADYEAWMPITEELVRRYNAHDELVAFVTDVAKQETRGNMSDYDFMVIAARRVLAIARGDKA